MKIKDCIIQPAQDIAMGKTVLDAAKVMQKHSTRYLYVTDRKVPQGVVSSTDIVSKLVAQGLPADKTKVEQIMQSPLHACDENDAIGDVYLKMAKFNLVSLPVLQKQKLIGIITMQELMRIFVEKGSSLENKVEGKTKVEKRGSKKS